MCISLIEFRGLVILMPFITGSYPPPFSHRSLNYEKRELMKMLYLGFSVFIAHLWVSVFVQSTSGGNIFDGVWTRYWSPGTAKYNDELLFGNVPFRRPWVGFLLWFLFSLSLHTFYLFWKGNGQFVHGLLPCIHFLTVKFTGQKLRNFLSI